MRVENVFSLPWQDFPFLRLMGTVFSKFTSCCPLLPPEISLRIRTTNVNHKIRFILNNDLLQIFSLRQLDVLEHAVTKRLLFYFLIILYYTIRIQIAG